MHYPRLLPHLRFSRTNPKTPTPSAIVNDFQFLAATATAANSWGTWLQTQPAPKAKPGHKLLPLSLYIYGYEQEYALALDLTERWGYALNAGYGRDQNNAIADSKLANPVTAKGKLLKLAKTDPVKYPLASVVAQKYPEPSVVPEGYLRDAAGNVIGDWSPEATPAAMTAAVNFKMANIRQLKAEGYQISTIYDGGETGLSVPGSGNYNADPRVATARGSEDIVDYISRRKGEHQRLFYQAVKADAPERAVYIHYPNVANPYANVPDARLSNWNYDQMFNIGDKPSGSVYFRDFFTPYSGMGNPAIRDRAYYDQLTHFSGAVSEQISGYGQALTYNFVSAGWFHTDAQGNLLPVNQDQFFISIKSYKGFLKCMYALGSLGQTGGYFSKDCAIGESTYPAYNPNAVPHWLEQQTALGEVHARMSWFDEFIVNGDLLPGVGAHPVKSYVPSMELPTYNKIGSFYTKDSRTRAFVRKLKNSNQWLVVLWSFEQPNGEAVIDGDSVSVYVRDIPGVETLQFLSRPQGSIYTIDKTGSNTIVTHQDVDSI